ncbi:MAG TPA: isoleucine--tRNA ligase, partial [Solirubrobacteraceae bacterium]|nr:isoleucine--tRNA ligase [Solirubrobacteraceae bacterium]
MTPLHPVDPKADFPRLEEGVLARWRERDVFAESLRRRREAPVWSFNEGPPFPNAAPGVHHVLARVFKDIFSRYRTMTGHYVERKGGWDCHGLPVELALEAELGFKSKDDIEQFGIAEFNARCRAKVGSHIAEFNAMTERIGYWVDLDDAYRTMDTSYVESVWWALKEIHSRGLLYERLKVVPYCPRDQVTLSSHELGQPGVYQDVLDPSVYVVFPSERGQLLVWTTTPWTLVSNAAVAVDPDLIYVRTTDGYILAEALLERVLGPEAEVAERFPGRDLEELRYEPPFDFIPGTEYGPKGHTVVLGDFVTADAGTGLVHTAIAFGEDDFRLGEQYGLNVVNPVRPDGTYDERIGPYAGRWVKDADPDLIEDLRARGRLFRAESYEHSYPHCWRCREPLIYMAVSSWFVSTTKIRERMLDLNQQIRWVPEHVKDGQFGRWLENTRDWSISRNRFWGSPIPVWRSDDPAYPRIDVYGSLDELERDFGVRPDNLHRPFIDELTRPNPDDPTGRSTMRRVTDVLDCWFESGSMSFAQVHYPFDNQEWFERHYPGDFIVEYIGQTRGWFYTLHVLATALFDRPAFKTCLAHGIVLGDDGQKMSKRLRNYPDPEAMFETHGADAMR